jgi:hypothetical protein
MMLLLNLASTWPTRQILEDVSSVLVALQIRDCLPRWPIKLILKDVSNVLAFLKYEHGDQLD